MTQEESPVQRMEDVPKDMSAEARREARRNKILQNREGRLQRILGPNSEEEARRIVASTPPVPDEDPVLPEEFLTYEFLQNAKSQRPKSSSINQTTTNGSRTESRPVLSAPFWKTYRLYLALLGALLPVLGLNYFLIYFVLLEIGVVVYYGQIPVPPSPPNMLFTLVLVMGLKEQDVNRIKSAMRIGSWILKDFCVFIISNIIFQSLAHLVYKGLKM